MFSKFRTAATAAGKGMARRQRQQQQPQKFAVQHQQRRAMGGDMPVPQSQNAQLWAGHTVKHEGWEESIYFYYIAGLLLQGLVIAGAPETRIESWARPEAEARLYLASPEGGGHTDFVFGTHYQELVKASQKDIWTKFSDKAINPGDDDDDDDDDDDNDDEDEEEGDEVRKKSIDPDRSIGFDQQPIDTVKIDTTYNFISYLF